MPACFRVCKGIKNIYLYQI